MLELDVVVVVVVVDELYGVPCSEGLVHSAFHHPQHEYCCSLTLKTNKQTNNNNNTTDEMKIVKRRVCI